MTGKRTINLEELALRNKLVFDSIYHSFLKRKAVLAEKQLSESVYFTATFKQAKRFPLLALLKHRRVKGQLNRLEIMMKIEKDPYISDADLDLLVLDAKNSPETLFIVVTRGNVSKKNLDDISRAFREKGVLVLLLGDPDMARIEKWASSKNTNACLVYLLILAEGIAWVGRKTHTQEYAKAVTEKRLDYMGDLNGQLRTVIKKLEFLLSFEEMGNIKATAKHINVGRKTCYNWLRDDPVFRKLKEMSAEMKTEEYFSDGWDELIEKTEKNAKAWERKLSKPVGDLPPLWDF